MIKKISMVLVIFMMLVGTLSMYTNAYAVTGNEVLNSTQATELVEIKETAKDKLADYVEKYGSTAFGLAAYILNAVRIYSIPFCFLGIAFSAIYQYVIGIRKLDTQEKGLVMMVSFITILVICQILPLAFAIVVKFGRG